MKETTNRRLKGLKHILAHEFNSPIIVSLFCVFSFLLFFIWYGFKYFTDASIYSGLADDLSNQVDIVRYLITNQILFSLISLIVIPLSFILFGGLVGYLCELNLNFSKPSIKIYFISIKKTFKYSLIVGFIAAFIYNLCAFIKWGNNPIYSVFYLGIIILSLLFIYPPLVFVMFEGYIYQGKVFVALKNGFILFFQEPLVNALYFYLSIVPMVLFFVFSEMYFVYFLLLILAIYGFGFILIVLSNRIFLILDRYVNKFNYPKLYEKNIDIVLRE